MIIRTKANKGNGDRIVHLSGVQKCKYHIGISRHSRSTEFWLGFRETKARATSDKQNIQLKISKSCIWPFQHDLIAFTVVENQKWPPYLYVGSHGSTPLLWCCIEQMWRCRTGVWVQSISVYRHLVLAALSTLRPLHWGCCTLGAPQTSPLHTLPVSAARLKQTQHTKAPQCHCLRAKRAIQFKPLVHDTVRVALPRPPGMCEFFIQ